MKDPSAKPVPWSPARLQALGTPASDGAGARADKCRDAAAPRSQGDGGMGLIAMPRVLFVDDEPAVLEGIRLVLRKEPIRILTAETPEAALRIIEEEHIDVIVSDECMPGMSGSDFLMVVRSLVPNTPRIVLTGHGTMNMAVRAINEGEVFRFLTKPCDPVLLCFAIRDALHHRRLAESKAGT
ncbi:MAG: response regulator [Deltaproteobacteria bacterium]|nr:response regulator [Deltaproteobacteria bacterium]